MSSVGSGLLNYLEHKENSVNISIHENKFHSPIILSDFKSFKTASHYQDIIGQDTFKNDTTHAMAGWISWQLSGSLLTAVLCQLNSACFLSIAICSFKDY